MTSLIREHPDLWKYPRAITEVMSLFTSSNHHIIQSNLVSAIPAVIQRGAVESHRVQPMTVSSCA